MPEFRSDSYWSQKINEGMDEIIKQRDTRRVEQSKMSTKYVATEIERAYNIIDQQLLQLEQRTASSRPDLVTLETELETARNILYRLLP